MCATSKGLAEMLPGSQPIAFYRTLGVGDFWPVEVMATRLDGTIDLELGTGVRLTKIKVHAGERADCPRGEAWRGAWSAQKNKPRREQPQIRFMP